MLWKVLGTSPEVHLGLWTELHMTTLLSAQKGLCELQAILKAPTQCPRHASGALLFPNLYIYIYIWVFPDLHCSSLLYIVPAVYA